MFWHAPLNKKTMHWRVAVHGQIPAFAAGSAAPIRPERTPPYLLLARTSPAGHIQAVGGSHPRPLPSCGWSRSRDAGDFSTYQKQKYRPRSNRANAPSAGPSKSGKTGKDHPCPVVFVALFSSPPDSFHNRNETCEISREKSEKIWTPYRLRRSFMRSFR